MRPVPFEDLERFQTICRSAEIPAELVDVYWKYKRVHDALDCGKPLETSELCFIAILSRVPLPEPPPPKVPKIRQQDVGQVVMVKFRNKETEAELLAINGEIAVVRLDGESQERELPLDRVLGPLAKA